MRSVSDFGCFMIVKYCKISHMEKGRNIFTSLGEKSSGNTQNEFRYYIKAKEGHTTSHERI